MSWATKKRNKLHQNDDEFNSGHANFRLSVGHSGGNWLYESVAREIFGLEIHI